MDALLVSVMENNKNLHGTFNLDSIQLALLRVQIIGGTFPKESCCRSHRSHLHHYFFPSILFQLVHQDFCGVLSRKICRCDLSL